MKDLFTGIYTRFSSTPHSSFYNDIGGRMYLSEAPEGTAFPYCVYGLVNNAADWTFTEDTDDAVIEFTLYSDSASAVEITDAESKLRAEYDDCQLPSTAIGSWSHIWMQRGNSYLDKLPDILPDKSVWRYTVEYDVKLMK